MADPIRVQRKRVKGWKMPANTIYVGRPTRWGNPFSLTTFRGLTRQDIVRDYEHWLRRDLGYRSAENVYGKPPTTKEIRKFLRGKNLACFCPAGEPCHADVLLKIANRRPTTERAG